MINVVKEDYGDGTMQCRYHSYKNNSPVGGICAFCLQEKLGKLASSPFIVTTTSLPPSFTSHHSSSVLPITTTTHPYHHFKKSRIPFLSTQKNKNPNDPPSFSSSDHSNTTIFNRSKSSVMTRQCGTKVIESDNIDGLSAPHKRGFWSFTNFSKRHKIKQLACMVRTNKEEFDIVEENERALDRKVLRSRSVSRGNWSFSGDFLERISTKFGECALPRVESQGEGNPRLDLGFSESDKGP